MTVVYQMECDRVPARRRHRTRLNGNTINNCVPHRHEIIEIPQIQTSDYSLSDRTNHHYH
ncbi:hypothetical protein [Nostoc sp.]|uniref:hypothetical protein n=1 Tax=Nostoc sp. TaxID=1180 RepID=UPI002FFBB110